MDFAFFKEYVFPKFSFAGRSSQVDKNQRIWA